MNQISKSFFNYYCRQTVDAATRDCREIISLMKPTKDCLGYMDCVTPTVNHPETIHVWGYSYSRGLDLLTVLPKNVHMNNN